MSASSTPARSSSRAIPNSDLRMPLLQSAGSGSGSAGSLGSPSDDEELSVAFQSNPAFAAASISPNNSLPNPSSRTNFRPIQHANTSTPAAAAANSSASTNSQPDGSHSHSKRIRLPARHSRASSRQLGRSGGLVHSDSSSSDSEEEVLLTRWTDIAAEFDKEEKLALKSPAARNNDSEFLDSVLNKLKTVKNDEANSGSAAASASADGPDDRRDSNSSVSSQPPGISLDRRGSNFSLDGNRESPSRRPMTPLSLAFIGRSNSFDFRAFKQSTGGSSRNLLKQGSFRLNKKGEAADNQNNDDNDNGNSVGIGINPAPGSDSHPDNDDDCNPTDSDEFERVDHRDHPFRFLWLKSLQIVTKRIHYYVPILGWLPDYDVKKNLMGDLLAGITVGVLLIPQAITYAGLANLPPLNGLYAAFFPLLIYFLMGSSRHLSIGPEVTSSILIGKSIVNYPAVTALAGNPSDPAYSAALVEAGMALTLTIGFFSLGLGLFRLGFLDSILSRPVLGGFVIAVAATLITEQLPVLLGIRCPITQCSASESSADILYFVLSHIGDLHWPTTLVSICCCSCMLGVSYLKRRFPSRTLLTVFPDVLLVVIIMTTASYVWDWKNSLDISVIGSLKYGFRAPSAPNLSQGAAASLISAGLTITLLGFVETQLLNKKYSSMFGYSVSPNRELVALGLASIIGSCFGAYSAFGSIPRTKVAQVAGQKSNLANILASGVTLLAILIILPVFENTPKAVTGSIIFCVASSLFEFHELIFAFRVRQWVDLLLGIGMIFLTYFLGVDIGIFFAFTVCLLLAVKQTTLPGVAVLGRGFSEDDFHDFEDLDEETKEIEGIIIYKVDGPLYFANAEKLKDSTQRIDTWGGLHVHPSEQQVPLKLSSVVFDLSELKSVDASALSIFLEICQYYSKQNRRVALVHLRRGVRKCFERAGIIEVIKPANLFRNIEQAVKDIQSDNLVKLQPNNPMRSRSNSPSLSYSSMNPSPGPASPSINGSSGAETPRSKGKSAFFNSPTIGSPLLRGIKKLQMK